MPPIAALQKKESGLIAELDSLGKYGSVLYYETWRRLKIGLVKVRDDIFHAQHEVPN